MGYSTTDGATGKALGSFTTTPSLTSDLNKTIELIGRMGNRRAGTNAARVALTGSALYDGLEYFETDTFERWLRTGGAWVLQSKPLTTFTPSWTNLTLGSGGTTDYAKYSVTNGWVDLALSVTLGTSPTVGDITLALPVNTSLPSASPIGKSTLVDDSAGAIGRFDAPAYVSTTSAVRLVRTDQADGRMQVLSTTTPFVWALSDKILLTLRYPV